MPQVSAFPFDRVPRLRRRDLLVLRALRGALGPNRADGLRRWAGRMGLPAEQPCTLGARLLSGPGPGRQPCLDAAAVRLALQGPQGRRAGLLLDRGLGAALIALLLRSEPTPLLTPPSAGERGLLTYAIAALLQEVAPLGWTVSVCEEPPVIEAEGVLLEATVRLGRAGGLAWLVLEDGAPIDEPTSSPALDPRRLRGVSFQLPLELARLRLPCDELPTLGPGDVVLFPGCPRPAPDHPALLRVGAGGFPARVTGLDAAGLTARIDEPFRMGGLMSEPRERRVVAEQLELEVVVEVGRARMSAAQLLELGPGDVLTLERPLAAPLELRVGDRLVARGELVDVEGEAGVRLTQLYD